MSLSQLNRLPVSSFRLSTHSLSIMFSNSDPDTFDSATLPAIRFKAKINNEYSFLSNFYPDVKNFKEGVTPALASPGRMFMWGMLQFDSVEQLYQHRKFEHIGDGDYAHLIFINREAQAVKKLSGKGFYVQWKYERLASQGRKTTKASIKRDFEEKLKTFPRLAVMREALFLKFTQNPELKAALLATGDRRLEEQGRMKSEYWSHTGGNFLGRLLMELRSQLRQ